MQYLYIRIIHLQQNILYLKYLKLIVRLSLKLVN